MSIQKKVVPAKGICRVTFALPETITDHANRVALVGDFNNWHPEKNLLHKSKTGRFQTTIELPLGQDYQFRYLIDSYRWECDYEADALAKTPYEDEYNSVVICSRH
jgi:1,4-alpha-glucan branching enzyme